jgi:aspartyl/glutamyl-tRNA(Asn/Gln) amidotransferase C subunit
MTDTITPETFAHLVQLAALELTAEEAAYLRAQLNNQLKAIHELEAIPLEQDTPVNLHGVSFTPLLSPAARQDDWAPYPQPTSILAQAPETDEGYIVVPEIPHTQLD